MLAEGYFARVNMFDAASWLQTRYSAIQHWFDGPNGIVQEDVLKLNPRRRGSEEILENGLFLDALQQQPHATSSFEITCRDSALQPGSTALPCSSNIRAARSRST